MTIAGPTEARPADGRTVDFVVVPDRAQLSELVQRVRDGRLRTNIGKVAALDDAVAAFNRPSGLRERLSSTFIRKDSAIAQRPPEGLCCLVVTYVVLHRVSIRAH